MAYANVLSTQKTLGNLASLPGMTSLYAKRSYRILYLHARNIHVKQRYHKSFFKF